MSKDTGPLHVSVVMPAYRVRHQVLTVLEHIGPEVDSIFLVDDACPEASGDLVLAESSDTRIRVIHRKENGGVGAATISGYREAIACGADVIVKLDADGQMDPRLIPSLITPIADGRADYTKGNRFYDPAGVRRMPVKRKLGNAGLSFLTKLSSGYWKLFDPTNGFTAVHRNVVSLIPLSKISRRFFFESDMLFRLNLVGAVVVDVPMKASYGDEISSLKEGRAILTFAGHNVKNTCKRIAYNYFIRDFSIASVELIAGSLLLLFGVIFGAIRWVEHYSAQQVASAGTVMLAALPIILGSQLLLSFLNFDLARAVTMPIHDRADLFPTVDDNQTDGTIDLYKMTRVG